MSFRAAIEENFSEENFILYSYTDFPCNCAFINIDRRNLYYIGEVKMRNKPYNIQKQKIYATKPAAIIVDLDDVLFYTNPIFKKAAEMNLSGDDLWGFFHEKVEGCPINRWAADMVSRYIRAGITPVFITARSEEIRLETGMSIMKSLNITYFDLYMRKIGDKRSSEIVKEEILLDKVLPLYNVEFALDDDIKNCEMYAKHGIPVLHVMNAEGKLNKKLVKVNG